MNRRGLFWTVVGVASCALIYFAPDKQDGVAHLHPKASQVASSVQVIRSDNSPSQAVERAVDRVVSRYNLAGAGASMARIFPEPKPMPPPAKTGTEAVSSSQSAPPPGPKVQFLGTTRIDSSSQLLLRIDDQIVHLAQGDVFDHRFRLDRLGFPKSTLTDLIANRQIELDTGEPN